VFLNKEPALKGADMNLITVELTNEGDTDLITWSASPIPTAEALERLIAVAADARSAMEPAFPNRLPLIINEGTGLRVDHPAWQWAFQADGTLVLNVRHPGLGWLMFRMPDADQFHQNLSNVLAQRDALRAEQGPAEG